MVSSALPASCTNVVFAWCNDAPSRCRRMANAPRRRDRYNSTRILACVRACDDFLLEVTRSRRWKLTLFVKGVAFEDAVGQKVIDLRADGRTDVWHFIGARF